MQIQESELIINSRGAVYHLNLRPEELAPLIITVGDPGRVEKISKFFDEIEFKASHREFLTHTGRIGKKRISVISTGIGPDNIDIVVNELDALVNIDFNTRTIKEEITELKILRMGTSGSLQADIPVDEIVVSTHGLGFDNLLNYYNHRQNEEESEILRNFKNQIHAPGLSQPYIASGSAALLKIFAGSFHHGITVTCPGFYGPQGRILRLGLANPGLIESLTGFNFGPHRITNFEMETSAIYGLGKLLHHQCLSLNVIVANRVNKTFSKDSQKAVEMLIDKGLEKLLASD